MNKTLVKQLETDVALLKRELVIAQEQARALGRGLSETKYKLYDLESKSQPTFGLQTTDKTRINQLELHVKQLTNILIKAGILDTLSMHDAVEVNGTKYNLNRVH